MAAGFVMLTLAVGCIRPAGGQDISEGRGCPNTTTVCRISLSDATREELTKSCPGDAFSREPGVMVSGRCIYSTAYSQGQQWVDVGSVRARQCFNLSSGGCQADGCPGGGSDLCYESFAACGSGKPHWYFCSKHSECQCGCCSNQYSNDGKLKCTPGGCSDGNPDNYACHFCWKLHGGCANRCHPDEASDDGELKCTPAGCSASGSARDPDSVGNLEKKGDWNFCSNNDECANGCCSNQYSDDGKLKCTPNGCGRRLAANRCQWQQEQEHPDQTDVTSTEVSATAASTTTRIHTTTSSSIVPNPGPNKDTKNNKDTKKLVYTLVAGSNALAVLCVLLLVRGKVRATCDAPPKKRGSCSSLARKSRDPAWAAISVEQLLDLREKAKQELGDRYRHATMCDINKHLIQPACAREGKPYAHIVNGDGLRRASVFISHAWAENFDEFVTSVSRAFHSWAVKPDIWICALALLQSTDPKVVAQQVGLSKNPNNAPFTRALKQADKLLIVRNRAVDLYSRIWCCWEFFVAHENGLTERPGAILVVGPAAFSSHDRFDIAKADSTDPEDKRKILSHVVKCSTYANVNSILNKIKNHAQELTDSA